MPLSLPIDNPVLIFALAMVIFLVAPRLLQRFRIPGIVGLILAGTVVGPHVLGLLERDFTFQLLGTVGLLYLIFQAGLELDLNRFNEYRRRSVVFGLLSFGLPMGLSLAVMPHLGFGLPGAALLGAVVGSHTLLAYPIASRLGITKNPAVITVVGGTLVTDTLALGVLAAVAGAQTGEAAAPAFWLRLAGVLAAFVVAVLWAVPRIGRWFFRNVPGEGPGEFLFLMVVLFVSAWGAELAGAEAIIGAFLAGLALNRLIPLTSPLMSQVRFVGNALFVPFFLLSVGMLVDPLAVAGSAEIALLAAALVALVLAGKLGGAWLTKWIFRYERDEALTMLGLSSPQAAATLAVTFVGLELGLLGEGVVNAVIVLILATVLVGPWLVERFGREVALHEERKPYDPRSAPRRILIPVSNPETADAMLDIAFALREDDPGEPVYPLMVVPGRGRGSEAQVAEAETMLSHAVLYAADAEVPVTPLTRVDPNVATGIARAVTETRSSVVVVGWKGGAARGGIFGSLLDQLLEMTTQLVIVARLGHPLNTTRRFVVIVPGGSDHHPGFPASVLATTTLAGALEARIGGLVVGEDAARYRTAFEEMPPRVPVEMESVEGWGPLLGELRHRLVPDDLVVVLSGRPGTVSWHRELQSLPARLADLVPESFLFVYAPDAPAGGLPMAAPDPLPRGLSVERIVVGLPDGPWEDALGELFRRSLDGGPELVEAARERTVASEREFSSEIRPGIALPHAQVPGLEEPLLFLGIAPSGIEFPGASAPVKVVIALLSPPDLRQAHLRMLSDLARQFRGSGRAEGLAGARSVEDVVEWFREEQ